MAIIGGSGKRQQHQRAAAENLAKRNRRQLNPQPTICIWRLNDQWRKTAEQAKAGMAR